MLAGKVRLLGTTGMQSIFLWDEHPFPSAPSCLESSQLILSSQAAQSPSVSPISFSFWGWEPFGSRGLSLSMEIPRSTVLQTLLPPFCLSPENRHPPSRTKKSVSNAGEIWDEAQWAIGYPAKQGSDFWTESSQMNNAAGGMADFEGFYFSGGALLYFSLNLHPAKLRNGFFFFFFITSVYLFYAQAITHFPLSC